MLYLASQIKIYTDDKEIYFHIHIRGTRGMVTHLDPKQHQETHYGKKKKKLNIFLQRRCKDYVHAIYHVNNYIKSMFNEKNNINYNKHFGL